VKSNALGLKLSAHGTHNAARFDRRPPVGSLCDCNTGVLTDQSPSVASRDAKLGRDVVDLKAEFVEASGADKPIDAQVNGPIDLQRLEERKQLIVGVGRSPQPPLHRPPCHV
jgi:hypothetical protein